MPSRRVVLCLIGLVLGFAARPEAQQGAVAPPASPAANYLIGPKDVLRITVFGEPDLTNRLCTVDADGMFSFPMIGRVQAAGLTIVQLESALRGKLAPDYFRDPQIAIAIDQYLSKQITVSGEVRTPGQQPFTGGMTLLGVLARAGGALPTASGEVLIARARSTAPAQASPGGVRTAEEKDDAAVESVRIDLARLQSGALELDAEIRDGDMVLVPRAESAYVFGEVRNPGAYPVRTNSTLQQLLSLAGGMTDDAAAGRISIDRDGKTLRQVKLTDIVKPGDSIKVPPKYF